MTSRAELPFSDEELEADQDHDIPGAGPGGRVSAGRRLEDYYYWKEADKYIELVTGIMLPERGVDASISEQYWARIPQAPDARGRERPDRLEKPSATLRRADFGQTVDGVSWLPGREQMLDGYAVNADGVFECEGTRIINAYRPGPGRLPEDDAAKDGGPWAALVRRLYPDPEAHEYFFDYCAQMLQQPDRKPVGIIVLSGTTGIGKDQILKPLQECVGRWNSRNISPDDLFQQYKPWLQSIMLVIDEVRPMRTDFHASQMNDLLKPLGAAPPDMFPINEKFRPVRWVPNVIRTFITTNHYMSMFIPDEDRRLVILHSESESEWHLSAEAQQEFNGNFFARYNEHMFGERQGWRAMLAWLLERDVSGRSFHEAPTTKMRASIAHVDDDNSDKLRDLIAACGRPDVMFLSELKDKTYDDREWFAEYVKMSRFRHDLSSAGYYRVMSQDKGRDRSSWEFQAENGGVFRSRYALARRDVMGAKPIDSIRAMVKKRGLEIASSAPKAPAKGSDTEAGGQPRD